MPSAQYIIPNRQFVNIFMSKPSTRGYSSVPLCVAGSTRRRRKRRRREGWKGGEWG